MHTILFLAKQGLPFRGDKESVIAVKNPGNFMALMSLLRLIPYCMTTCTNLARAKNVTYMYLSPKSQNDITSVIGFHVVHANIVDEVRKAGFFSVMADEVSIHNVEHMPICLHFVDEKCNIREDFLAFVRLERVRAGDISNWRDLDCL